MEDLKILSSFALPPAKLAERLSRIATPLQLSAWRDALASHPDRQFAEYIINGISHGFRIGFDHTSWGGRVRLKSALDNPRVVEHYLEEEFEASCIVEVHTEDGLITRESSFGVIPKKSQPNKWRLIVDLSSPTGAAVNDGIPASLCSLSYPSVHDAAKLAANLGRGALLAKIDLKSAYRAVPVHPQDRWLLAMRWKNKTFIDCMLPFGLRSAPKIFTALADALQWVMEQAGVPPLP